MPEIDGIMLPFLPAGGVDELKKQTLHQMPNRLDTSFEDIFREELSKLKFSSHAQSRLSSRDINLNQQDITRLEDAVSKANEKGASESVVMLDKNAYIVSIPNKTVITVVDSNNMEDRVITNIDSVVFA